MSLRWADSQFVGFVMGRLLKTCQILLRNKCQYFRPFYLLMSIAPTCYNNCSDRQNQDIYSDIFSHGGAIKIMEITLNCRRQIDGKIYFELKNNSKSEIDIHSVIAFKLPLNEICKFCSSIDYLQTWAIHSK